MHVRFAPIKFVAAFGTVGTLSYTHIKCSPFLVLCCFEKQQGLAGTKIQSKVSNFWRVYRKLTEPVAFAAAAAVVETAVMAVV